MKRKFIYISTIILLLTFFITPINNAIAQENITDYNQVSEEDRCKSEELFTKQVIKRIGHCNNDNECVIMNFGCPFGCNSLVNKNERIDVAKATVATYVSKCKKCEYKCKKETRKPKCIFGRCSIEE